MSNTGNPPPGGTPPASKPGDDDPPPSSQTPPASSPAPASSPPPASTPAPASTPPDSAPASAPPDSSPPASDASPPSSQTPDSKPPDSDGCAEIPTAAHAVLTAEIKLVVQLPFAPDSDEPPHKLTLSNEDGSYSKTLSFPSDCQAGATDGTSVMTFDGLTDGHTYSLQWDGDDGSYVVFDPVNYHELVDKLGGQGDGASPDSSPPSGTPAAGTADQNAGGTS